MLAVPVLGILPPAPPSLAAPLPVPVAGASDLLGGDPLAIRAPHHPAAAPPAAPAAAPAAAAAAAPTVVSPVATATPVSPVTLAAPATPLNPAQPADPADPAGDGTELVLDRTRKLLRVLNGGRELRRFPVAVGMPGWETPVGRFQVIEMAANPVWKHPAKGTVFPPGPTNPLGSRWIGFHRDCRDRSGFNGNEHLVVKGCATAGFHGTNDRTSVGRAASHGCVRLYDEDVVELFGLVRMGTPVTVLP